MKKKTIERPGKVVAEVVVEEEAVVTNTLTMIPTTTTQIVIKIVENLPAETWIGNQSLPKGNPLAAMMMHL